MAKKSPTPKAIKVARKTAQLTQAQAADRIYARPRTWEDWEGGRADMHPGLFELFQIKTGQIGG